MKPIYQNLLFCGIVILLGLATYGHTLDYSWHFDDYEFIVLNKRVHDLTDMKAVWEAGASPSRFLAFLSFAVNYHYSQLNVQSYHVVNIIIHMFNAILVWLLIRVLLCTPQIRPLKYASSRDLISYGVSLLFLVHPIQTQAVTYITQRFASLATFFYLSSVLFYLYARLQKKKERRIPFFIGAFFMGVCGMFTKQILLTLPFMIILIELNFFQDKTTWQNFKKNFRWYYLSPIFILFTIIPSVYGWNFMWLLRVRGISRSHEGDIITMWSYFLTQFRVVSTYIRLLFVPLGQTLDYDFAVSKSLLEPKVILGAVFLGSIIYLGIKNYKNNRLFAFGIFWFFLCLMIESSIIPILQVIFEHRCYLPSVGFFLVIVIFLIDHLKKRYVVITLCILVSVLGIMTYERNKVWATEISLWEDINEKVPQKQRSYLHLGVAYLMQGRYHEALTKLDEAIEINSKNHKAFHNRAIIFSEMQQLDMALADFNQAVELSPKSVETLNGRGTIYEKMGNNVEAFKDYNRALQVWDKHAGALYNRGNLFIKAKKYNLALIDLQKAQSLGYPVDPQRIARLARIVQQIQP